MALAVGSLASRSPLRPAAPQQAGEFEQGLVDQRLAMAASGSSGGHVEFNPPSKAQAQYGSRRVPSSDAGVDVDQSSAPSWPATVRFVREQPPCVDRLAVRTFVMDGEEIAYGDTSISDAQRAAAGRETVAERSEALLAANHQRAAEQYATGTLPDGQDVLRVWWPRDPAALRQRLGAASLAVWAESDILHVFWQGHAEQVQLIAGVQPRLWPVEGTDDLWEASLRIRRLEEAVIRIMVAPQRRGGHDDDHTSDMLVWRGPQAPAILPTTQHLRGTLTEQVLDSPRLGGTRAVTIYRPPHPKDQGPLPGCVLADGASAAAFARILEPAILAGTAPPVLLVGVHNAVNLAKPGPDRRAQEYLPRQNPPRFAAHLGFVVDQVIPWASGRHEAEVGPWVAAGFSNGGAWAVAAAQRRPEVFTRVAAFSVGVVPRRITGPARTAKIRHYLAAGTLEAGFRQATRQWAQRLQRAGLDCRYQEWVGGHDHLWWGQQLPAALQWLLARP